MSTDSSRKRKHDTDLSDEQPLPKGWEKRMTNEYYYFNVHTEKKQWERPKSDVEEDLKNVKQKDSHRSNSRRTDKSTHSKEDTRKETNHKDSHRSSSRRTDKNTRGKEDSRNKLEELLIGGGDMEKLMGFSGFDTTKNKKVADNVDGMAKINKPRKYRQYMNRKGGFNRPLDFVA